MKQTVADKLIDFVTKRPGFNPELYNSVSSYKRDRLVAYSARNDFNALLRLVKSVTGDDKDLDSSLVKHALKSGGRLLWNEEAEQWDYCPGQCFSTEYRGAACNLLARVIWSAMCDDYDNADELRMRLKKILRRSIIKSYF